MSQQSTVQCVVRLKSVMSTLAINKVMAMDAYADELV